MPIYNNALTNQPANRLAYPVDSNLGAAFGNPNIQRQGARARALAQERNVNTLPDPKTYAAVAGLLGTAPNEMGFSPMQLGLPQYQQIMQVAEPAFYTGTALGVAPMVGLASKALGSGAKTLGPTAARMTEEYLVKTGGILPMDVYQGTPHTFPPTARNPLGEFDASKIGTGEGAQVYGHGIYTAEAPAVAKRYQKALSNPEVVLKDGTRISNPATGSSEDVAKAWLEEAYLNGDKTPFDTAIKKVSMLRNSANSPKQFDGALDVLNNWKKSGASVDLGGNLYKADLPDKMVAKMLDYDKPLSQQPEIMKALTPEAMGLKLRVSPQSGFMGYVSPDGVPIGLQIKGATPENFRKRWLERLAEFGDAEGGAGRAIGYLGGTSENSAAQVSEALRQAGIPGIKYFDEGSRIKGEGTRNFVTFPGEEKNLTIFESNGQKATRTNNPASK